MASALMAIVHTRREPVGSAATLSSSTPRSGRVSIQVRPFVLIVAVGRAP